MADNQQHWGNFTGGQTSKAKKATVLPPKKKRVSTMMVERVAKAVQSTAKNISIHAHPDISIQNKVRSMADNQQQHWGNFTGGQTSKAKKATVIPPKKKPVSTMMVEHVAKAVQSTAKRELLLQNKVRSMAENQQQHWGNLTGGQTLKAKKATVIPPKKKPVSTMMAERVAKAVQSTAKSFKDKNKINPT
ncbi:hypothetical protein OSB04_029147 [Centaurea solstitialis]|uniref:Uncharacterized protein n=1 Tax=Centaurea solstitialis TaxID=347529 RepID=A0AA38SVH4_9ASTR|nr:hypothetical protein OSB04_029147 [Centaurea solstitialis]